MEIKSVTHGPLGDVHTVRMMEYNSADSVYTYNEYNSLGEHVLAVGKIEGQKWVWNTTKKLNGVTTKGRYITTFVTLMHIRSSQKCRSRAVDGSR